MKFKKKNNTRSGPRFPIIDFVIHTLQSSPFSPQTRFFEERTTTLREILARNA